MAGLPTPEDTARRVAAAMAYADIEVKQAQEKVGISPATMARIVSRTSPRGFKNEAELERVAGACDVPRGFLTDGFTRDDPTLGERVEALERKIESVIRRLGGDDPPEMPGELRRPPGAPAPSAHTGHDGETAPAPDAETGTAR